MSLGIIIELLSLSLALTGLLLQTRRDPSVPTSWHNLSNGGRFVLVLLVLVASAKIVKSQNDSRAQHEASVKLQISNNDLIETNKHLIKVMSVAGGYSALISGIVVFDGIPAKQKVEEALRNLFLKYAEVEVTASNRLGTYEGRVDYGAHPEVRRYLNLTHVQDDSILVRLRNRIPIDQWPRAFFYEIRCANFKILNAEKIQYARFDQNERMQAAAGVFEWWPDFRSLYGARSLYIDKLKIEELEEIPIGREF
jgi:hypothetical protein